MRKAIDIKRNDDRIVSTYLRCSIWDIDAWTSVQSKVHLHDWLWCNFKLRQSKKSKTGRIRLCRVTKAIHLYRQELSSKSPLLKTYSWDGKLSRKERLAFARVVVSFLGADYHALTDPDFGSCVKYYLEEEKI